MCIIGISITMHTKGTMNLDGYGKLMHKRLRPGVTWDGELAKSGWRGLCGAFGQEILLDTGCRVFYAFYEWDYTGGRAFVILEQEGMLAVVDERCGPLRTLNGQWNPKSTSLTKLIGRAWQAGMGLNDMPLGAVWKVAELMGKLEPEMFASRFQASVGPQPAFALWALRHAGEGALKHLPRTALLPLLQSPDSETRLAAMRLLPLCGDPTTAHDVHVAREVPV